MSIDDEPRSRRPRCQAILLFNLSRHLRRGVSPLVLTTGYTKVDPQKEVRRATIPTVKTAISLPKSIFQRAEAVARVLQISRSQLGATAGSEFLKQYERKALVEAINQAFEDEPPTAEEKELLQGIRAALLEAFTKA